VWYPARIDQRQRLRGTRGLRDLKPKDLEVRGARSASRFVSLGDENRWVLPRHIVRTPATAWDGAALSGGTSTTFPDNHVCRTQV
jgi:hypothetical protein